MTPDQRSAADSMIRGVEIGLHLAEEIAKKHSTLVNAISGIHEERAKFHLLNGGFSVVSIRQTSLEQVLGINQMQPGDLGFEYLS